jgi:hypothetical protein
MSTSLRIPKLNIKERVSGIIIELISVLDLNYECADWGLESERHFSSWGLIRARLLVENFKHNIYRIPVLVDAKAAQAIIFKDFGQKIFFLR